MRSKFILFAGAVMISASAYAQPIVSTNGQKHVVIHEGTGAWCGWCVDGAWICDEFMQAEPKVYAISVHNGDAMAIGTGDAYNTAYATGYPFGTVDCAVQNVSPQHPNSVGFGRGGSNPYTQSYWVQFANTRLAMSAKYDIVMEQSFDEATNKLTIKVTGTALEDIDGSYNVNVCITENEVTGSGASYDQKNFLKDHASYTHSPYHSQPAVITGYKHERVLREMLGGTWGQLLATDPRANTTESKTFTYTVTDPALIAKMQVVAYIQKANASDKNDREIINSIHADMINWDPTTVKNVENMTSVSIYPNPVSDMLVVKAMLSTPANTKIEMRNALGQLVYSQTYPAGSSVFGAKISTNNMTNGVYFVTVSSEGQNHVEKVIVNK